MNDEIMKEALEIVKAQAGVRIMTEEELLSMVRKIAAGLEELMAEPSESSAGPAIGSVDSRKTIRDRTVICLECGRTFKVLTKKHLASHGLDADSYCDKHGLKRGTQLVCRELQRMRRKKMQEMKLWERRRSSSKRIEK